MIIIISLLLSIFFFEVSRFVLLWFNVDTMSIGFTCVPLAVFVICLLSSITGLSMSMAGKKEGEQWKRK